MRLRTFSISAASRSRRSLRSAVSLASASTGSASGAGVSISGRGSNPSCAMVSSLIIVSQFVGMPVVPANLPRISASWPKDSALAQFSADSVLFPSRHHRGNRLGGVIDHRNDPGIVEPGGADDAQNADDLFVGVAIGAQDHRRTGQREQLVLAADEDADAVGLFGVAELVDQSGLPLELVEQPPHAG